MHVVDSEQPLNCETYEGGGGGGGEGKVMTFLLAVRLSLAGILRRV